MKTTLAFVCLSFILASSTPTEHRIDVDWNQIYPASNYIQLGDTVTWFGTDPTQVHAIWRLKSDFSGSWDFTAPGFIPQSPFSTPGAAFSFSHIFTASDLQYEDQGFIWGDILHPQGASFGVVYVSRPNSVYNTPDVFVEVDLWANPQSPAASNPPFLTASDYPRNATVAPGQRVIWEDYDEPLISHMISIGNKQNYRTACTTGQWQHTFAFTRRSSVWAHVFNTVGHFNWNCLIHPNEFGFIDVCHNGNCGGWTACPDPYGGNNGDGNSQGNGGN